MLITLLVCAIAICVYPFYGIELFHCIYKVDFIDHHKEVSVTSPMYKLLHVLFFFMSNQ